nr:MAG TPA: hypothetical protein [Bacteriophage sp.]
MEDSYHLTLTSLHESSQENLFNSYPLLNFKQFRLDMKPGKRMVSRI